MLLQLFPYLRLCLAFMLIRLTASGLSPAGYRSFRWFWPRCSIPGQAAARRRSTRLPRSSDGPFLPTDARRGKWALTMRPMGGILALIESGSSGRGAIPHRWYSPRAARHDSVRFRSRQYSLDERRSCVRGSQKRLRPWKRPGMLIHSGVLSFPSGAGPPAFHDALNRPFKAFFLCWEASMNDWE